MIASARSGGRGKRKATSFFLSEGKQDERDDEDDGMSITEDIKRVRLSTTPGLLRAQKDAKEFNEERDDDYSVEMRVNHTEESIYCHFNHLPMNCPRAFRIDIPRFYPHSPPVVHCLSPLTGNNMSALISPVTGVCSHPSLKEAWLATMTLTTVVDVIKQIILEYQGEMGCSAFDGHPPMCLGNNRPRCNTESSAMEDGNI